MIHVFHFEAMDMLRTCLAGNCMTSGTQIYNFYFLKVKHLHKIKSILCKNCLVIGEGFQMGQVCRRCSELDS